MNNKTLNWTPGTEPSYGDRRTPALRPTGMVHLVPDEPHRERTKSGFAPRYQPPADTIVSPVAGMPADDTLVMSAEARESALGALLALHPPGPSRPTLVPDAETTVDENESAPKPKAKAPFLDAMKLNKLVVSSYKIMGFAVLATILFGLASFIFTNLFYMANESWVTPMVVSSTDPRVLQLNAQYATEKAARDAVATQRLDIASRLADSLRIAASEHNFQHSFDEAMKANLADRAGELAMFQHLGGALEQTRRDVTATNNEYAGASKEQLKEEYAARLIDKEQQARGGYELSQIAGANIALHQKNVEIDARIADLRRQVSSLQSAGGGSGAMSYDILHMRHEYEQSRLASQKAEGDADALSKSLAMIDKTLGDYEAQLARIGKAPYLLAADRSVTTAFVPYDNLGAVKIGDKVYGCALSVMWCKSMGHVAEVLDGEVIGKHPLHNREMRGVLVRLTVDDPRAMEHAVLHLRRAPLGI